MTGLGRAAEGQPPPPLNKVTMERETFNNGLLEFLGAATSPFHAVAELARRLREAGFEPLNEADAWNVEPGGRHYLTRNDSSIIAFKAGTESPPQEGLRMVGAHTDSPCLMVKPNPERRSHGYQQLGVEVYGGALLNPWFDRDLSLAGRVTWLDPAGELRKGLVDFREPLAVIPSLAIHLDREANRKRSVNPQKDIPPVLGTFEKMDIRESPRRPGAPGAPQGRRGQGAGLRTVLLRHPAPAAGGAGAGVHSLGPAGQPAQLLRWAAGHR